MRVQAPEVEGRVGPKRCVSPGTVKNMVEGIWLQKLTCCFRSPPFGDVPCI